ncbi:MAG: glycosyltransferase [Firmicutes bacterium]|nr:glycosyltransferase [Bacillota bacterium]
MHNAIRDQFNPPWPEAERAGVLNQQGHLQWNSASLEEHPLHWKWSAVIPAHNEGRTIAQVLQAVQELPLDQIIVVVNGSIDDTKAVAERYGCRVLEYDSVLGHDIGRALGAKSAIEADAEAVLFMDADIIVRSHELFPFLSGVERGLDVALNDVSRLTLFNPQHPVNIAKAYLNWVLGRSDLGYSSMTGIPHALSRKAIEAIGCAPLAVPPLAHAKAVLAGLSVGVAGPVDVVARNRIHGVDSRFSSGQLEHIILGDHLEALAYLVSIRGVRGGFTDGERERSRLGPFEARPPGSLASAPATRAVVPHGWAQKLKSSGSDPHPKQR